MEKLSLSVGPKKLALEANMPLLVNVTRLYHLLFGKRKIGERFGFGIGFALQF